MDPNSTNYGGSTGGNSNLGAGTDSLGVTGAGAGQGSTSGGLTPSSAGSQGMGGSYNSAGSSQSTQTYGEQSSGGQSLGERASDLKDQAADKLSQARDVAGEKLGQAREMAGERLGQAREKATELKATLADKLDQGAEALRNRQQGGAPQFGGANGGTVGATDSLNKYAAPAATAMEKTAEFLRGEGDLKSAIEEQVRTAPGRTLLIAVGLGYVLGKAIRR